MKLDRAAHGRHELCFHPCRGTIRGRDDLEQGLTASEISGIDYQANDAHALFDDSGEGTPQDERSAPHAALDERLDRAHVTLSRSARIHERRRDTIVSRRRDDWRSERMPETLRAVSLDPESASPLARPRVTPRPLSACASRTRVRSRTDRPNPSAARSSLGDARCMYRLDCSSR